LDQNPVLVDISTSRIFELNETGTRIWELLGQGPNVEQIVQHLVSEFEVEDSQAAEELKTLLSQPRIRGLSQLTTSSHVLFIRLSAQQSMVVNAQRF
jgi:hypothetical protein